MSYSAPITLDVALELAQTPDQVTVAGGTDVYPAMQQGRSPKHFLDVTRIPGFREIEMSDKGVRFGAAVTWTQVIKADLPPAFSALQQAGCQVGGVQIQNAGTLAGNICNASPAADGIPPLLALDAEIEVASATGGLRREPLSDFVQGVRRTSLGKGELVTAILVPRQPDAARSAFEKLGSRTHLVISITMTAANIVLGPEGRITEARIAVGACAAKAQRLGALERDLIGCAPDEVTVTEAHLAPLSPIDDVRGSAAYRLEAVAEQCRRAIARAAG